MVVSPSRSVSAWNPWGELNQFQRELESLFGNGNAQAAPRMRFELQEQGARAEVDLPGFAPEDVHVDVRDSLLTLRAKRAARGLRGAVEFERSYDVGFPIEEAKVVAQLKQGVLELELPRAEADKPKRIAVRGD